MQRKQLCFGKEFRLAINHQRSQAAEMVLKPGDQEGGPDNCHRGSDQWLFVVSGTGVAIVNEHRYPLKAGALLLIERGDKHEVRVTGDAVLRTLNIYVPPAFADDDTLLPSGRPSK